MSSSPPSGQAVGAEKEEVPDRLRPLRRSTARVSSMPTARRMTLRRECFLASSGDEAFVELLLDQGMVAGQLPQPPFSQEIGPAVAHVPQNITGGAEGHQIGRAPHFAELSPPRLLQDPFISQGKGLLHAQMAFFLRMGAGVGEDLQGCSMNMRLANSPLFPRPFHPPRPGGPIRASKARHLRCWTSPGPYPISEALDSEHGRRAS